MLRSDLDQLDIRGSRPGWLKCRGRAGIRTAADGSADTSSALRNPPDSVVADLDAVTQERVEDGG